MNDHIIIKNKNNKINVEKAFFGLYNSLAKTVYPRIPFTYYWYLVRLVGKEGKSLIDFGCGWGDPVEVLQKHKKRMAIGIDIFEKYLKVVRKRNIYKRLIKADITKYKPDRKYDIVICSHVLEHLPKRVGQKLIDKFEKVATRKIVLAMPVGDLPQGEYDGNEHQRHMSSWFPSDLTEKGFKVYGFSPKFLFGKSDVVHNMGIFGLFLFFLSYILEPFYVRLPEKCVYMLAVKEK